MLKQLTLGELIKAVEAYETFDPDKGVYFDFVYFQPDGVNSYRGSYDQLAVGYKEYPTDENCTVADLLTELRAAVGKTFEGYKGGDYSMTLDTPVWVANRNESGGTAVVGVIDGGWRLIIVTAATGVNEEPAVVENDNEQAQESSAPPCPYISQDEGGTPHCALGETGIKVWEWIAKENEQKALDWQHEFNMYRSAWLRELGGEVFGKTHEIDAFVLTTRAMRKELEQRCRPLSMILHCPQCHTQHIDAPETDKDFQERVSKHYHHGPLASLSSHRLKRWTNPPHKSHQCHTCGCTWRPAEVETYGVAAIESRGKNDTWPAVTEVKDNEVS